MVVVHPVALVAGQRDDVFRAGGLVVPAGGSALTTALLSVCSYAPYVLMSIFAGALSDRWDKRRTMIACGLFAALTTVAALALNWAGRLEIWHPYILNALNGLMNTVQQPASAVAVNLLIPEEHNQRVGGLQSLTNGLVTVLTPMLASTMMLSLGLGAALLFLILEGADVATCLVFLRDKHIWALDRRGA